jgi:hypothetical protein
LWDYALSFQSAFGNIWVSPMNLLKLYIYIIHTYIYVQRSGSTVWGWTFVWCRIKVAQQPVKQPARMEAALPVPYSGVRIEGGFGLNRPVPFFSRGRDKKGCEGGCARCTMHDHAGYAGGEHRVLLPLCFFFPPWQR